MQINLSWDSTVASAPNEAAFKAAVQAAANILDGAILNPISVTIQVGWGSDAGAAIPANALATGGPSSTPVSYSQLVNALTTTAQANGNSQIAASLPVTDPLAATAAGQWEVGSAEAQALGLGSLFSGATGNDGTVGFGSSENWSYGSTVGSSQYDLIGVALHELTHALGRVNFSSTTTFDPLNLYTYAAPGSLQLVSGQPDYFSVNGGITNLNNFDTVGDTGDWASTVSGDSFGYGASGVQGKLTFTDLLVMEALGYKMAPAYTITGPDSLTPGAAVALTVQTINVAPGTPVNYTISGIPASSLSSGSLTGTTIIGADGTATINLGVAANAPDSGSTSALVSVNNGQATYTVTVGGAPFTPGAMTNSQIASSNTGVITTLSYNFSVDKLPTNGTDYSWSLDFYGSPSSGDAGQIGIETNGYGNQGGGLGSNLTLTVWNATSGTAGPNGTVNTYTGTSPSVTEATPFSFSAGTHYTFTLTQSGSTLTASILNDATGVTTQIGSIYSPTADNLLSGSYVTSSEVNATVASAADVAPVLATWDGFSANGIAGIDNTAAPYAHDATATANGVDYATIVTASGISQFTGGAGNNTLTLSNGNNTVWLGTQPDNVVCGNSGTDTINCGAQNETITMGGAAATVSGGTGSTVVAFSGNYAHYAFASTASGHTVTDTTGANGMATLQNVDFLKFADQTLYVGPALTTASGALSASAEVDALYVAILGQAPGFSQALAGLTYSSTQLANLLLTQAGLTNVTAGTTAIFNNLGLSISGDNGLSTDVANNQAGLYQAVVYLAQYNADFIKAGGLGFIAQWLVNAMGSITGTNNSYAAYSAAAATLDTNIASAQLYSAQSAHLNPVAIGTAAVGLTGVLTQPLDQVKGPW